MCVYLYTFNFTYLELCFCVFLFREFLLSVMRQALLKALEIQQ